MKALLVVDIQYDFCPGGALAVADGDAILPGINAIAEGFELVITTQDWHPQNHGSFASNHPGAKPYDMGKLGGRDQVLWPDHCVQGTRGAELHKDLVAGHRNFQKGANPEADSYSAFFDDDGASTGLAEYLREVGVDAVVICGLATDYCVKFTALHARKEGFDTTVISDLTRGVNVEPEDSARALSAMREAGVKVITSSQLRGPKA